MKRYAIFAFCIYMLLSDFVMAAEPQAVIIEKETHYGKISYPQISGLADKNIEQSINNIILEDAANWNCDFDGEPENPESMDYNAWTTLRLIDEQYLSFTVSKDYFCGGAHPNQQIDAYNFDLKQGNPVTLNGLLVPEMLDEHLTTRLLADYKFEVEGCEDAYIDINWDYYRTKDRIVFLPRLARIAQECFEEFPVPVEELKTYMWTELEEDRD